ncbi:MAG: alpha/beta hydrolase [Chloroflexi bacterium]|nr:MAG: alpha/beta hydrolase [Chloroflexota bacterium]
MYVTSRDGTSIAFDRCGDGPPVILVDGALAYRENWGGRPLATELEKDFSVYVYDRRGRGESTDTQPYAVEREIEDIAALIEEAGGPVHLYGASSGAVLALKAAARLGPARVAKLALYEAPFSPVEEDRQLFDEYVERVTELLRAGKRGDAVAYFLGDAVPPEMLEAMRQSPEWPLMEAVAPTLAYENELLGDSLVPVDEARAATMPALVLHGSESPAYMREVAEALARTLPRAQLTSLQGQTHAVDPEAIAPVLRGFFRA